MAEAGPGDPVADRDVVDVATNGDHCSDQGIAERNGFGDQVLDDLVGRPEPFCARAVDNFSREVRPVERLAEIGFTAQSDDGAIGSGADQGRMNTNQNAV
ncbi:MAG: hypothetical protein ABJG19_02820 [Nitratireductor sp.]